MSANEARYGQLMGQDAAAYGRTFDAPVEQRFAFELSGHSVLTQEQAERVMKLPGWNSQSMSITPTPGGARMINFDRSAGGIARFEDLVQRVGKEIGAKPEGKAFDGALLKNAWDKPEGRVGQQYMRYAAPVDRPGLAATFDTSMPHLHGQIKTLDEMFAKDYGFTVSPHPQEMRAAIASDGRAGIAALVRRLGLGAAAVAPMLSAAEQLGLLAPQGPATSENTLHP